MSVLRTTYTKMGVTVNQLTWPTNAMTFEYDSAALNGTFRGRIDPVPRAGWEVTVFDPGRNIIPSVDRHPTKNLNDAVAYLENYIRTEEKQHLDHIDRTTKQEYQQSREVHTLFTPRE